MEFGSLNSDGYTSNGSGQLRSDPFSEEGNRGSKMGKRVEDDLGLRSESKQQMLSFSSSDKGEEVVGVFADGDLRLVSEQNGLSFFNQNDDSGNNRCDDSGIGLGNGGMHGSLTGIRGPFTPAQWIELEHQAMIYKYFTANVPVPSNLLIPIKKAIQSAVFPGLSFGSYPSHSYGWGSFHLGFSSSTDPEPGRCRRTDGKKWRCSRDAVPEQKYCERHINRGRHRSRKPVEGHTGQAAFGVSTTKAVSSVTPCGGVSSGTATVQHQIKGLQSAGVAHTSTEPIAERLNDQQGLSVRTTTVNVDSKDSQYDGSSVSEFGIVSNDALLNPSQKRTYLDCKNYNPLLDFNTGQNQEDQNSLRYFTDNWPKDQSHSSAIPWPKDLKADWTQLSMSIPVSKDYSLSSSSTNHEKVELDTPQMRLGIGNIVVEGETKRNAWIPIPGGNSMGGPLGEVLLNNTSPEHESLQKTTFVSLSKSTSGGSPRGEKKMVEGGASLCDDLLGLATHATCASIPSM